MKMILNIDFMRVVLVLVVSGAFLSHSEFKIRRGYQDSLKSVIQQIRTNGTLDANAIAFCLPENDEEAGLYYELDYSDETSKEFQRLTALTLEYCINGHREVLKKYMCVSQFVDGYFAENYFDTIGRVTSAQRDLFCSTYRQLPSKSVKRLSKVYERDCK